MRFSSVAFPNTHRLSSTFAGFPHTRAPARWRWCPLVLFAQWYVLTELDRFFKKCLLLLSVSWNSASLHHDGKSWADMRLSWLYLAGVIGLWGGERWGRGEGRWSKRWSVSICSPAVELCVEALMWARWGGDGGMRAQRIDETHRKPAEVQTLCSQRQKQRCDHSSNKVKFIFLFKASRFTIGQLVISIHNCSYFNVYKQFSHTIVHNNCYALINVIFTYPLTVKHFLCPNFC